MAHCLPVPHLLPSFLLSSSPTFDDPNLGNLSFTIFNPKTQNSQSLCPYLLTGMEFANRLVAAATKAANNNTVINVCLVGSFLVLAARSANQQKNIEALKAEKDSLVKSNKAVKKTMWDWKQQLFSEAETGSDLVTVARLRAIYGEAPQSETGEAEKEEAKSPASKLVI